MNPKSELERREFDVLVVLSEADHSLTQRAIAEKTGISIGSANKICKTFLEREYISDGRITDSGIAALEPYRVKRAVILAAGFGSRLVPITFNTPKPLVRVNGTRMVDTLLDAIMAAEIPEIIIVRGYLAEQFDQLLYKYPTIKFVENPVYNETNNISSAMCVRYMLQNAYVLEADLILSNPKIIRKYEYCSNFLGIPVDVTDDWCLYTDASGRVIKECVGGTECHQMVGISYWDARAGAQLASDIEDVYRSPGGKERYWEQVAFEYRKNHYRVEIRECVLEDIVEVDTLSELKAIDSLYDL